MHEQLVLKDTAILAKEKGFNIACLYCVTETFEHDSLNMFNDTIKSPYIGPRVYKTEFISKYDNIICYVPTQSLLQKWLREVHRVDIQILRDKPGYNEYQVEIYKTDDTNVYLHFYIKEENGIYIKWFDNYEEALEAGLIEGLKRIK